jgi:hypothetical protein
MYQSLEVSDRPLLLILDTFEKVLIRRRDPIKDLWSFLDELRSRIPTLRIVLAGQACVEIIETTNLELDDLKAQSAHGFLEAHGITNHSLAERVVEQVGGNPLSLILAADLLKKEAAGREGIRRLRIQDWFGRRLPDNEI